MANDYRVMLTKKMFKKGLLELLKTKRIGEITVKELCDNAGVNRGTFYSHYEDIFALLKEIEGDLERSLQETLGGDILIDKKFFIKLIEFFEQNLDMCVIVLSANGNGGFLETLLDFGRDRYIEEYLQYYPDLSKEKLQLSYTFISAGCLQLVRGWINKELNLDKERFSELLEGITYNANNFVMADIKDEKKD